jgi:hypothetical protein
MPDRSLVARNLASRLAPLGCALAIALAGCGLPSEEGCGPFGSCPSTIEFQGRTYHGVSARAMQIEPADLTEIGAAAASNPLVSGTTVYGLEGVDPAELVVMSLKPGEDEDYILYSNGQLEHTPEVCRYYPDPPADC